MIFVFLLTSCAFFSYVEDNDQDSTNYEVIESLRNDYIFNLIALSQESYYYDTERAQYINYLIEGKAELNESQDQAELNEIFIKYSELIKGLKTIEAYEAELNSKKAEYIDKLLSYSSIDNYREEERKIYEEYIASATKYFNQISSAQDEGFDKIFQVFTEAISKLKTIQEYLEEEKIEFIQYQNVQINKIENWFDLGQYRSIEQEKIKNLIECFKEKILASQERNDIENLVREFIIEGYKFQTDNELYELELSELKDISILEVHQYKNISDYRSNEKLILQTILESFDLQITNSKTKDEVLAILSLYKEMIASIKNDKELYEEERLQLIDDYYNEFYSFVDFESLSEEEQQQYITRLEKLKEECLLLQTKDEVKSKFIEEKENMYLIGAQLGDISCLREIQIILLSKLEVYLDKSLYRIEQQIEIDQIIRTNSSLLKEEITYEKTMKKLDEIHILLEQVKTNNEMWLLEDEAWKIELGNLYGKNVLQMPNLLEADNYFELSEIIDFYAFYQLDTTSFLRNRFRIKLNFNYKNIEEIYNNLISFYSELARYSVGITLEMEDDYLVVSLEAFDFSTKDNWDDNQKVSKKKSLISYNSISNTHTKRKDDFDEFEYYSYGKTLVGIWNTQQLWYALEHEYIPVCVEGSIAETVLNEAKNILRNIICNEMDEGEKIFSIYKWFSENVQFDYHSTSKIKDRCSYAEGAILDRLALCRGYAKAYLILLRLEGIESYIVYNTELSHDFNLISYEGELYSSDLTYGYWDSFVSYRCLMLPNSIPITFKSEKPFAETSSDIYNNLIYQDFCIYKCDKENLEALVEIFALLDDKSSSINIIYETLDFSNLSIPDSLGVYYMVEHNIGVFQHEIIIYFDY